MNNIVNQVVAPVSLIPTNPLPNFSFLRKVLVVKKGLATTEVVELTAADTPFEIIQPLFDAGMSSVFAMESLDLDLSTTKINDDEIINSVVTVLLVGFSEEEIQLANWGTFLIKGGVSSRTISSVTTEAVQQNVVLDKTTTEPDLHVKLFGQFLTSSTWKPLVLAVPRFQFSATQRVASTNEANLSAEKGVSVIMQDTQYSSGVIWNFLIDNRNPLIKYVTLEIALTMQSYIVNYLATNLPKNTREEQIPLITALEAKISDNYISTKLLDTVNVSMELPSATDPRTWNATVLLGFGEYVQRVRIDISSITVI
jgi:hypothetical protein